MRKKLKLVQLFNKSNFAVIINFPKLKKYVFFLIFSINSLKKFYSLKTNYNHRILIIQKKNPRVQKFVFQLEYKNHHSILTFRKLKFKVYKTKHSARSVINLQSLQIIPNKKVTNNENHSWETSRTAVRGKCLQISLQPAINKNKLRLSPSLSACQLRMRLVVAWQPACSPVGLAVAWQRRPCCWAAAWRNVGMTPASRRSSFFSRNLNFEEL